MSAAAALALGSKALLPSLPALCSLTLARNDIHSVGHFGALLRAGASEWNWTAEPGGMRVRAYWRHPRRSRRRYVAAAAAVFGLVYCWWYDVHLTQAAARWLAALRR